MLLKFGAHIIGIIISKMRTGKMMSLSIRRLIADTAWWKRLGINLPEITLNLFAEYVGWHLI